MELGKAQYSFSSASTKVLFAAIANDNLQAKRSCIAKSTVAHCKALFSIIIASAKFSLHLRDVQLFLVFLILHSC